MGKHLSSDKPVSKKEEDKFQRYEFSKRIATSIIEREGGECIAIGVYGAWGEGKTSVINFIENELKKNSEVITIKFNPWRYSDENSLLIQFFQKLATALDSSLKSRKQKIGDVIKEYGQLLSVDIPWVGNAGETFSKVGELLSKVDIETLKERIENLLIKSKKRVVVFIDDIDRLDKDESYSVFRLVKLNADFANTVYVLSFDEERVASAIGERFGTGGKEAGRDFLEKIIQIPLKIPLAQPVALKDYCFALIDKVFQHHKFEFDKQDAQRFVTNFTSHVLIRLQTPRLAVRYSNTLSFSIPLLHGEVNIVDLMLIEAVKIFYPTYYSFIKENPEYFIGGYGESFTYGKDSEKMKTLQQNLDNLSIGLTKNQKRKIQDLLVELFPRLNEALNNYATYGTGHFKEWRKNKRIASSAYFSRYFSYCVIKGEISDVAFKTFVGGLQRMSDAEVVSQIQDLAKQSSPESLIDKIRTHEEEYAWEDFVKLSRGISISPDIFPMRKSGFVFGFDTARGQSAIFISQGLKKSSEIKDKTLELAKTLLDLAKTFDFAYDLNYWLRPNKDEQNPPFTDEEYAEFDNILLQRAIKEAKNVPLFEKFPDQVSFLYRAWAIRDKKDLEKHLKGIIKKDAKKSVGLLLAFTPTAYSSAHPDPYKTDFQKANFDTLISILDKDYLKESFSKVFSENEISGESVKWDNHYENFQTDINTVRQFLHWYDKSPA